MQFESNFKNLSEQILKKLILKMVEKIFYLGEKRAWYIEARGRICNKIVWKRAS